MEDQNELIKLVKDMKDTVVEQGKKTDEKLDEMDALTKEKLQKMGDDLIVTQRQIEEIKADRVTIEKEKEEIKVDLKPIFDSGSTGKSLQSLYSIDIEGSPAKDQMSVRKMLYAPRTNFNASNRTWNRDKSYDGLEYLMDINDTAYFAGLALSHHTKRPYLDVVKELKSYQFLNQEIQASSELRKALDTSDSSEFVPTQFSARLLDDVRLQLKVAALFQRLALPRSPFTNPILGDRQVAYLVGQSTSDTSAKIPTSDPIAANVTFTAIKFAVRNLFSDEFAEDSIIPVMPWVRSETTHQHSDVTASNDRRKAFDGLLLLSGGSSGNAAVDISTLSVANLRSIRKGMGRFGANSEKLAWIMSVSAYVQCLSLDEVETIDKFGPMATVQAGELAKFDGAPVIVSEFVRSDLNTSGVYDGATTTDTEVFLVHTPSFLFGDVGAAKAESDRDIETQQTIVVTSRRTSFKEIHTPGTGEETVGLGYSLTA
jgi:hypothetical protein